MAAKDTDRRDRRDIERGGSGRRGGVCHCFRVWFECVALLGFSILIRTMYWLLTGNVLSPSGLLMCPFADMAWWRGNGIPLPAILTRIVLGFGFFFF
jgi:hypothetical protein